MAARGVGALIGPFIGHRLAGPGHRRLLPVIACSLATFGIGYALLGLAPALWLAAASILVAHLGGGSQWVLSTYGLQRLVPDEIRGRIFAFDFALITLSLGTSSLVVSTLADHIGARPAVLLAGGVAVAWAGIWWLLTRTVRREPLFREPDVAVLELERPAARRRIARRQPGGGGGVLPPRATTAGGRRRGRLGRCGRRRGLGARGLAHRREVDLGHAGIAPQRLVHLEELLEREVAEPRDDHRRERLHPAVVVPDVAVVEAARGLEPVLGVGQLRLQREEVLVGLQVRVVLGDGQQLPQRGHEGALGGGLRGRRSGRGGRHRARLRDVFEDLLLVRGVALHRRHEVRDQVVSPTQLGVDVGPRILDQVALGHEPVVARDAADHDQDQQREDDDRPDAHGFPLLAP